MARLRLAGDRLQVHAGLCRQAQLDLASELVGQHFLVAALERVEGCAHDRLGRRLRPVDVAHEVRVDEAHVHAEDLRALGAQFLAQDSIEAARVQMETNFFGPLLTARAFAPVLAANRGGAIINVLSVASWINRPLLGVYGATKSAAWALTNGLRHELREQGTQVLGMHMGFVATDLTRGIDMPKSTPEEVVRRTLDALEAGAEEVLADELTRQVKQGLSAEPAVYLAP